jgi:hypothetical protein
LFLIFQFAIFTSFLSHHSKTQSINYYHEVSLSMLAQKEVSSGVGMSLRTLAKRHLRRNSSSEIGKRTMTDRSLYYESLPLPSKHHQTILESDTAADNVNFPPYVSSGDDGNTDSDIIAEESAPSCSVWQLHWKDELTAVSEYCIKSEPSTTGPALPSMGAPAPPILKSSGRHSVVDRVGLIHER